MEEQSDEALMLEYGNGNIEAFVVLYSRHKDSLHRFVHRQCRDPDIAYDLVQEIWLKLIKARRRYRPEAKFTTYLFAMARNRLIDYYRAQAARLPAAQSAAQPIDPQEIPDPDEPEMRAHIRDLLERSLERIDGLPQAQREAFLLYAEGLRPVEIAVITEVPAETARSRIRGALTRLRQDLGGLDS